MDVYNGTYIDTEGRAQGWPAEFLRKNLETTEAQRQGFTRAHGRASTSYSEPTPRCTRMDSTHGSSRSWWGVAWRRWKRSRRRPRSRPDTWAGSAMSVRCNPAASATLSRSRAIRSRTFRGRERCGRGQGRACFQAAAVASLDSDFLTEARTGDAAQLAPEPVAHRCAEPEPTDRAGHQHLRARRRTDTSSSMVRPRRRGPPRAHRRGYPRTCGAGALHTLTFRPFTRGRGPGADRQARPSTAGPRRAATTRTAATHRTQQSETATSSRSPARSCAPCTPPSGHASNCLLFSAGERRVALHR